MARYANGAGILWMTMTITPTYALSVCANVTTHVMMTPRFEKGQRVAQIVDHCRTRFGVVHAVEKNEVWVKFDTWTTIMTTGDEPVLSECCQGNDLYPLTKLPE